MRQFVSSDVLVLCPNKYYKDNFIKDSITNIGLNVINIIYTTDYFKEIDKFLENNFGFSIFIYSNITKTDIYKNKYGTGIYTLYDIYYNYNNLIYNYYNEIINDYNYKKAIKARFITFNSTITFEVSNILAETFNYNYYNNLLNDYQELFPNSFLPKVLAIDNFPLSIEVLEPLESSTIRLENNSKYQENNYKILDDKLAIDNKFGVKNASSTFVMFDKTNLSSILSSTFYQTYLQKFPKSKFVLLLVLDSGNDYEILKKDKEASVILEMFKNQLSIVDKKSLPNFFKNFIKHMTKNYKNVDLKVPCQDAEINDYIKRKIITTSTYRMNDFMHYKAIINDDEEEKLIQYIE